MTAERECWLQLNGWFGRTQQKAVLVDSTPKRYRVRFLTKTRLAGRNRWGLPGQTALVPKTTVTLEPVPGVSIST